MRSSTIQGTVGRCMHPSDLLAPSVWSRVQNRTALLFDMARLDERSDEVLLLSTLNCLKNLGRLEDEVQGPDAELRTILIPEIWERIQPGTRDPLRRITSTLAEYRGDAQSPSFFARLLSREKRESLRASADELRLRVAAAKDTDLSSLVERARFAIAGSRAAKKWEPECPVYEPAFAYRLAPVVACRALARDATRTNR